VRALLLLVASIVFVESAFFAVVAPLLPHYEDELGLTKASAGVLLAAYPAGMLLAALPSGVLASRIGTKRTVLAGLALMGVASLIFAFAQTAVVADLARFVQGVGGACAWAGALAWLVAEAPGDRRGQLIGSAMAAAVGGALFGPVIGALASAIGTAPVFVAVAIVAVGLAGWAAATPGGGSVVATSPPLRRAIRADGLVFGMWLVTVPGLMLGLMDTIVPLRMDDLGASGTAVAAAFLIAAGGEALISPLVGRASDRHGRIVPIRTGLLLATVLVVVLPLPQHALAVAALLVLASMTLGLFWAPAMALVSDIAERVGLHLGPAFGLVNLAFGGGVMVGAAAGGAIADATTDAVPCAILAALCAGTFVVLMTQRLRTPGLLPSAPAKA
jgi:MFS family permease